MCQSCKHINKNLFLVYTNIQTKLTKGVLLDIILSDKANCSDVSLFPKHRVNFRHIGFISSPQSRSAKLKVSSAHSSKKNSRPQTVFLCSFDICVWLRWTKVFCMKLVQTAVDWECSFAALLLIKVYLRMKCLSIYLLPSFIFLFVIFRKCFCFLYFPN